MPAALTRLKRLRERTAIRCSYWSIPSFPIHATAQGSRGRENQRASSTQPPPPEEEREKTARLRFMSQWTSKNVEGSHEPTIDVDKTIARAKRSTHERQS